MDQDQQQSYWRRPTPEGATSPPVILPPAQSSPLSSPVPPPSTPPLAPSVPTPTPQSQPAPPAPSPTSSSIYNGYDLTPQSMSTVQPSAPRVDAEDEVSWQASEYIHWQKGAGWYGVFGLVMLAVLGVAVWLQLWTFAALVVVMAVAIIVYARRPPQELHYRLTSKGLEVEGKFYDFNQFRAFGIVPEGALYSILLLPTRRFMPTVTIYFSHDEAERIVDLLGANLPMEQLKHDFFDAAIRKLRF